MEFPRITFDPDDKGKASIRGSKIAVAEIMRWLAGGMTIDRILATHPQLQREDVDEALRFIAHSMDSEPAFPRITVDPKHMNGQPCIRGLRIPVAAIMRSLGSGKSREDILAAHPELEPADIDEALQYVAWLGEGRSA